MIILLRSEEQMQNTITISSAPIRKEASDRRTARAVRRALGVEAAYLRELTAKAPLTNRTSPAFCG